MKPRGQAAQVPPLSSTNSLKEQDAEQGTDAPTSPTKPGAHFVHEIEPGSDENEPAGHGAHAAAALEPPAARPYVPGAHLFSHESCPVSAVHAPCGHAVHVVCAAAGW